MTQTFILTSDEPLLKNDRAGVLLAQARERMPQAEFLLFTAAELRTRGLGVLENELADPGLFRRERIIRIYVEPPASRRGSYDFEAPGLDILNLCVATPGSGAVVILDLPRISYAYSRVPARTLSDEERRLFPREQKRRSAAAQKKEALAAIRGLGGSLEFFYAPEGRELGRFVRERAAACGLQLDGEALDYLCACGEGNLGVIDQALRQLQAALPPAASGGQSPPAVTAAQLQVLCEPDSRCAAEDFTVALFMGHSARALQVLSSLQRPGGSAASESLRQIVAQLNTSLSLIARARALPGGGGQGSDRFFAEHGVRLRSSREALAMAARFLSDDLLLLLSRLTAEAASALAGFGFARCRCLLQAMALCLTHPQARALHAPHCAGR